MSKILGTYKITYPKYKMSHMKNLISHEDYLNVYKPLSERIKELESECAELNKKKHADKISEYKKEIKTIKSSLKEMFGDEFFTTESPIWLSTANNGIMTLSSWQGGDIKVELEKLN